MSCTGASRRLWPTIFACAVFAGAAGPASAQVVLNGNPGPANNGGSANWAIFFDLVGVGSQPLSVYEMTTASTAAANASFSIEVFTRAGTSLGGPVGSGPGSSPAGWTSLGTVPATQGAVASQISLPIDIPDITVNPGETVGVAIRFNTVGPRYVSSTGAYTTYTDGTLSLVTGDARSVPFTTTGSWFSPRLFTGSVTYQGVPEPTSLTLVAAAAALGWRRWRRSNNRTEV